MTVIAPGVYSKGAKAIKSSAQYGETDTGNLQLGIDLEVKDDKGQVLGTMTTILFFTEKSAPYSYERLTALGWKGKGPADVKDLTGIDTNAVDVRVTQPESYKAADGSMKMGVSKIEILTGDGRMTMAKKVDPATFAARLAALGSGASGGGAPAQGGEEPPF
jgi:hypothetical protein